MVTETIQHIVRDEQGVAWVAGTNVKVVEIVLDHLAYGWSGEEIHEQHPHLTLAQICASLSFYHDHAEEFEREIERRCERVSSIRRATGESAIGC